MTVFETEHERKSMIITVVIYALLILFLFFFGMKYLDPPPESGIAINFGTSDVGMGSEQPTEPVKSSPQQNSAVPPVQEEVIEDVVTQDETDAPVIPEKEEKVSPVKNPTPVEKPKEVKKPDPKPDQSTTDALNAFNGPPKDGQTNGGEGNDNVAGDKGDPNGDPNASSYYGQGMGLDGDGNYLLGGRNALTKAKFVQDCNQEGTVVVEIEVDRNGKVIRATPGVKGTTNTSSCLTEPAKRAALATKFNSDSEAPAVQVGKIIYEFKLSE
ncbi:MAG TPA: energy transducer TonB [Salinimicrobium sp.]|nr:energy transducer TonB [Salinimicrobium sp.]